MLLEAITIINPRSSFSFQAGEKIVFVAWYMKSVSNFTCCSGCREGRWGKKLAKGSVGVSTWEDCIGLRILPELETGVASLSSVLLPFGAGPHRAAAPVPAGTVSFQV